MTLWFMVFACTQAKNEDTATDSNILMEYYQAETVITLESNQMQFDEGYLVRRSLDVEHATIFEEFFATADGTLVTTTLSVDMLAKTFTVAFSDDSYTGTGSFVGEGLDWQSWESNSQHSDGSFVISHDSKDASGIHTSKVGYGMDNQAEWTLDEELTPMSRDAWQSALDALLQQ